MFKKFKLLPILAAVLLLAGCNDDDEIASLDNQLQTLLATAGGTQGQDYFKLPSSTDFSSIPQDPRNPITTAKVELGEALFHETALAIVPKIASGKDTYSCASCHHAAAGFQAGVQQGIGEGGSGFGSNGSGRLPNSGYDLTDLDVQPIRTPTAMNGAFQHLMLWNGQFGGTGDNIGTEANWTAGTPKETNHLGFEGLETQAIAGMKVHRLDIDTNRLFPYGYKALFDAAFPDVAEADRYNRETAGLAMAAYERTIMSNQAPFQEWLNGDMTAMTDAEKEGAILFFGKANCVSCHTGPALNSMKFYAIGMNDLDGPGVYGVGDTEVADAGKGRGSFTGKEEDMFKFKVPQLYNLPNSPFYGHGGNFTSIKDVLDYKNAAVPQNSTVPTSQLATEFTPLNLTDAEIASLTLFLEKSLVDANLSRYEPTALPSGYCFPNADQQSKTDLGCN
ncbi:MAG: cytochrome c peroxidase [Flammeovirgaceae bacterium]